MLKKKKRNPNLSKYDAPLRIQFERGVNAFKGKQYINSSIILPSSVLLPTIPANTNVIR